MKKELKPMKEVLYIVVHCSATRVSKRWTVEDIDRCHKAKNWAMIGYHWVIYQDGSIHQGRDEKYAGAPVASTTKGATTTPVLPNRRQPSGFCWRISSGRTLRPRLSATATSPTSTRIVRVSTVSQSTNL